jgi:hypothetical protein
MHLQGQLSTSRAASERPTRVVEQLGTGFTDELLVSLGQSLDEHRVAKPLSYYRYSPSLTPDVWFDAAKVWEVKCADLSLSPHHHAAMGLVRVLVHSSRCSFDAFVVRRSTTPKAFRCVSLGFCVNATTSPSKTRPVPNKWPISIEIKRRSKAPLLTSSTAAPVPPTTTTTTTTNSTECLVCSCE